MRKLTVLVMAVAFLGCAKGGGADSSDGVGKAFVAAVNAQDKEALKKLFPPDELMKETFECKEAEEDITKTREGLAQELDGDLKGVTLTWKGEKDPRPKTMKAGEESDGCKYKKELTVVRVKWEFDITKDGKTENEGEGVSVGKFGDRWYLVGM